MRRLRLLLAIGLGVFGGFVALEPGDVVAQTGTASIVDTGWWSRSPTGTPGNAFEVARAPDGDLSVVASRIKVDGTVGKAELRLLEGGAAAGSPFMQLCVTTAPWTVAAPGPWEARPVPTCGATPVRLAHNEIQRVYTVELRPFLGSGQSPMSVMVVAAPDESTTVPPPRPEPPVDVPVAPPVTAPPPSTVPATTPVLLPFSIGFTGAELQTGDAPEPTVSTGDSSSGFDLAGDLGSEEAFFATPDVAPLDQPPIAAPSQVEGRLPTPRDVGVPGDGGVDQPWGRTPLLAVVAIGAGTTFGRQRLRQLRWLGAP